MRAALAELSLVKAAPDADSELWSPDTRHPTLLVALTMDRARLYERVDARVEAIVAAGARAEVLRAAQVGASRTARKALGFEELLAGDVAAMKLRSRRYARRQLTWMRKLERVVPDLVSLDVTMRDPTDVASEVARLVAADA
jgi:tRNA dimethylallyltransferase